MKTKEQKKLGTLSLLRLSFAELAANPILFLPKMISVTIYAVLYVLAMAEMKNALVTREISASYLGILAALLVFMPVWVMIDSLYPALAEQISRKEKPDFGKALWVVLRRIASIFGFVILIGVAAVIVMVPLLALAGAGLYLGNMALVAAAALLFVAIVLLLSIATYFMPTSVVLSKNDFLASLREGFGASKENLGIAIWLSILSFVVLAAGFAFEGVLAGVGIAGFVIARYAGGVLAVYLYIVNPTAYLEAKRKAKKGIRKKKNAKV